LPSCIFFNNATWFFAIILLLSAVDVGMMEELCVGSRARERKEIPYGFICWSLALCWNKLVLLALAPERIEESLLELRWLKGTL
jgi:hypothetical protein